MRFTIKAVLAVTVLVALGFHSAQRWRNIRAAEVETAALELEFSRVRKLNEIDYVAGHTTVCEQAIEANLLPSAYFAAAKSKYERLFQETSK